MPKASLGTYPKPGNMGRVVFTEDQIRKRQQGPKEELTRRKGEVVSLLACWSGGDLDWPAGAKG